MIEDIFGATRLSVQVSSTAHAVSPLHDVAPGWFPGYDLLSIDPAGRIFVMGEEGLKRVSDAGTELFPVDGGVVLNFGGCGGVDFVALGPQSIFFTPGCNGSPLLLMRDTGGDVLRSFPADTFGQQGVSGFGRSADGRSILLDAEEVVYRLWPDGGMVVLDIRPDLTAYGEDAGVNAPFGFHNMTVIEGPSGAIYFVGGQVGGLVVYVAK